MGRGSGDRSGSLTLGSPKFGPSVAGALEAGVPGVPNVFRSRVNFRRLNPRSYAI